MNISNFKFSDEFKKKTQNGLTKNKTGKLRLERIQEHCGNRIVDRKTILSAAGFNTEEITDSNTKTYAKAMAWLHSQIRRGTIERVLTGDVDKFNRPISDFCLIYVPKGNIMKNKQSKEKVKQKTYTKQSVKPVSLVANTKKYSIQITISTGTGKDTGTFDFKDIAKNDFIKKAEILFEAL